jgi:CysZ protein
MGRIPGDILRMIAVVSIALTLELILSGVWWLITGITGIHFLDGAVYFIIAAFFYGFSFYDYSLERYKIGITGSMNYAFSNALNMFLTGSIFLLLYNIPLVGVIIAPVLTTMLSTIVYLNHKSQATTNS